MPAEAAHLGGAGSKGTQLPRRRCGIRRDETLEPTPGLQRKLGRDGIATETVPRVSNSPVSGLSGIVFDREHDSRPYPRFVFQ